MAEPGTYAEAITYTEAVAEAVARAIAAAGSSQTAVAASGALPYVTLNRSLAGGRPFTVTELDRIAKFLGIDVELLSSPRRAAA